MKPVNWQITHFYTEGDNNLLVIGEGDRYDKTHLTYRPTAEEAILAGFKVYSVKRLSDNVQFTIGDMLFIEVEGKPYGKSIGMIDRLWQSFEQMRYDIGRMGGHIDMPVITKK